MLRLRHQQQDSLNHLNRVLVQGLKSEITFQAEVKCLKRITMARPLPRHCYLPNFPFNAASLLAKSPSACCFSTLLGFSRFLGCGFVSPFIDSEILFRLISTSSTVTSTLCCTLTKSDGLLTNVSDK